ncbi:Exosome complex component RRP41 -like protein [Babesia sp. Xinjiang]|uniref:Exosome complex component RRP41 -like protein n=1 Tax=Babesia sp. Xinjiang TaxID=462227 RepID=UPI000A254746|nr:Exosome complex component RRP41 -like protein [Babesia sp. Xinjiang]ORM39774.1 Exosome complex component RRP41 -like protein [Babesia sp. Xinjiang]
MSKIEYISFEGLRIDGRRQNEARNIEILCGIECGLDITDYDGAAQVTQGFNIAQAFVNGPTDSSKAKQREGSDYTESAVEIQCEVVLPGEKRFTGNKVNYETTYMAYVVRSTIERVILSQLYEDAAINVFVNVLEADGGVLATVINAVFIALIDAGIAMRDLVVACTAVMLNNELLLDPNQLELNAGIVELTLAVAVSTEEVLYIELSSKYSIKSVEEIIQFGIKGSASFSDVAKAALRRYAINYLELNKTLKADEHKLYIAT